MPSRCVVYGCSNYPDAGNQIALHPIPFYGDQQPESVKRRKRWVDFMKQKRAKWEGCVPKHFKSDDFIRRDEIGVTPYPTIHNLV